MYFIIIVIIKNYIHTIINQDMGLKEEFGGLSVVPVHFARFETFRRDMDTYFFPVFDGQLRGKSDTNNRESKIISIHRQKNISFLELFQNFKDFSLSNNENFKIHFCVRISYSHSSQHFILGIPA